MLANLVDVDEGMCRSVLLEEGSLAVFIDFAAAFPSVEHGFLSEIFKAAGWPDWLISFVDTLYSDNDCSIAIGGSRHEGFGLTRRVRQGCPLSPLLFAAASDMLIARIQRLLPGALVRAYADDIAIIIPKALDRLPILASIFEELEQISGLRLNVAKTYVVPLHKVAHEVLRAQITAIFPAWGQLAIADAAKYLGFIVGPGRGSRSCTKPSSSTSRAPRSGSSSALASAPPSAPTRCSSCRCCRSSHNSTSCPTTSRR